MGPQSTGNHKVLRRTSHQRRRSVVAANFVSSIADRRCSTGSRAGNSNEASHDGMSIIAVDQPETATLVDQPPHGKRKHSTIAMGYDRVTRARLNPPVPEYPPKTSIRFPDQLQAIEWLSASARLIFNRKFTAYLAAWGVSASY